MEATELKALLINEGFRPDDGIATHLLHACEVSGLPLSYGLALIQKETGFRNIFGHDPTTSIPKSWMGTKVTWLKYRYYRARRGTPPNTRYQGVGPAQLTWGPTQDLADKAGGCHKPYPNMLVAFRTLKEKTDRLGKERGAAAYNGSGPRADQYGRDFVEKQAHWHRLLT